MNYSPYVNYFTRVYWNKSYFVYKVNTVISFQSWKLLETFPFCRLTLCAEFLNGLRLFYEMLFYIAYVHAHTYTQMRTLHINYFTQLEYCRLTTAQHMRKLCSGPWKFWSVLQDTTSLPCLKIPLSSFSHLMSLFSGASIFCYLYCQLDWFYSGKCRR